jgi:hypothetical protein
MRWASVLIALAAALSAALPIANAEDTALGELRKDRPHVRDTATLIFIRATTAKWGGE